MSSMVSVHKSGQQAVLRHGTREQLAGALFGERNYTLAMVADLEPRDWQVPALPHHDPPLWTLGQLGFMQQTILLRGCASSVLPEATRLFDAGLHDRPSRHRLTLPPREKVHEYLQEIIESAAEVLIATHGDIGLADSARRVLAFEMTQSEALADLRQCLGLSRPQALAAIAATGPGEDLVMPGGRFHAGLFDPGSFSFAIERPTHETTVEPFEIGARPVTQLQFLEFVDDQGYENPLWWSEAGRRWLEREAARDGARIAPRGWQRRYDGGARRSDGAAVWSLERFGRRQSLALAEPVMHVTLFEAQAWCRWAGRRLPSELEWEYAAAYGHPGFRWGDVLEWTSSRFDPYPGGPRPGPEEAWMGIGLGSDSVLRGAAYSTRPERVDRRYRDHADPARNDRPTGFRTCSP
ncbi:ergothioneine biosynthesis protein EgtB [soil metagenome]